MDTLHQLTPRAHAELHTRASMLQGTQHTERAIALLEDGKVLRVEGQDNTWIVTGWKSGNRYEIRRSTCRCKTESEPGDTYKCAHLLAIYLYKRVEEEMRKEGQPMFVAETTAPGLPLGPTTPEEHLAQVPREVPQDDARQTLAAHEASEDREAGTALVEALREPQHRMPYSQTAAPRSCDLTPVDLPGGGQRTRSIGYLMQALAHAQTRMKNPMRDSFNPGFKSRYASMAETRNASIPVLAAEGISVTQWFSREDQELFCWTMLAHTTGEYQIMPVSVPCPTGGSGSPVQARCSAMSYAKRNALQAVVLVVGEDDDDGEGARDDRRGDRTAGQGFKPVPDMTQGGAQRKSVAELRQEIELLAQKQDRQVDYIWQAAKQRFGKSRDELTIDQLEQMLRGLQEKGAAA